MSPVRVAAHVLVAALLAVAVGAAPAAAVRPPQPAAAPPADVAPGGHAEQRTKCAVPVPAAQPSSATLAANSLLDVDRLHRLSTGRGQTIAIIDTGVTPHPRLPRVRDGGDFVTGSSGLADCDAHGTLVAGLIAARPAPTDDFAGLAPDVSLISIRQSSAAYSAPRRVRDDDPAATVGAGYGTIAGLAAAVMRAVRLGATVINISEVACVPAGAAGSLGDSGLGAALRHAVERDVVVVVAAGNVGADSGCRDQNPPAGRDRLWSSVRTVATPAWFSDYVLTVGAVDSTTGEPSSFSLAGPWVGIAAPGTGLTSLDSRRGRRGLVSGVAGADGPAPITGTSFSAAYASAVAALVRARHPDLEARGVVHRLTSTATGRGDAPNPQTGHGVIDPLAALTARLTDDQTPTAMRFQPAPAVPPPSRLPLVTALSGAALLVIALAVVAACTAPRRRLGPFDDGL
ncbi:MAG: type VII secretion-associated serine protease mycosin [Gordonia sp. (in: high G+C Gram-positive bacteria)]|uniref:type VII secretion-associated serine protease mycosin n=1 Tax=Gordonia sp. (in: high G+C Gram-positive bacteria) TaxID=84139 RepID=UPI0039E4C9B1